MKIHAELQKELQKAEEIMNLTEIDPEIIIVTIV